MKRGRDLQRLLAGEIYDLVVIGGGAAGAATLRAATLRGLKAALVERGDFAGGITSRSSRLIHGGLRYLEHGHWLLVREALAERRILIDTAPHLVEPIRMLIPLYRGGHRSPRAVRLGLWIYDGLAGRAQLAPSQLLAPDRLPGIAREGLQAIGVLTDARALAPERLVIETLIDAERQGGLAVNHVTCERISRVADHFELTLADAQTGRLDTIAARAIVNAAGPWAADVERRAGARAPHQLRFVRGSHLVLAPFPDAPREALLVEARRDGRPFFLLPWGEVIGVGTTEVEVESAAEPGAAIASDAEIDYLLAELRHVWPAAREVTPLATLAGLRPLPVDARSVAAASRRHQIAAAFGRGEPPFFTILGGKLTTHRREGEEAARAVARALGRGDQGSDEPTRKRQLPGMQCDPGPAFDPRALAARAGIGEDAARALLARWGCRAWAVAAGMAGERPIAGTGLFPAEIRFALEHEGALGLDDVLWRRTQVWQSPGLTRAGLSAAALVWAEALAASGLVETSAARDNGGHDEAEPARARAEAERVAALLSTRHHRTLP